MASKGLRDLHYSVLRLELDAIVEDAASSSAMLQRLGIDESPFYAKSAQGRVLSSARERDGPTGSFMILDAAGAVLESPVEPRGLPSRSRIMTLDAAKGLVGVDFPLPGKLYVGYERAFSPWGWTIYALIPADRPAASAVAALGPGFLVLFAGALAAGLASRSLAGRISRPLERLAEATRRMGGGDLAARAYPGGDEELSSLALSFNDMASRLAAMTAGLEDQVERRTAELSATIESLGKAQAQLVRAEKLGTLGRLSAGIAHELNTPLGAISSSSQTAAEILDRRLPELFRACAGLEGEAAEAGARALALSLESASAAVASAEDRRAARAALGELRKSYESAGIAEAAELAAVVEEAGLTGHADAVGRLLEAVGPRRSIELLSAVEEVGAARRMIQVTTQASSQAAYVVGALRNYLQSDEADEAEAVDVETGIEAVLALLYHKTKRTVSIERRIETGLKVRANANKLSQVWLNLINNALQAMEYAGELSIRAGREGTQIKVEVIDSGAGISEEARPHIFEPFFTTKRQGEGMGLGLDICKKIVEHYGGSIGFESEPGRTVFTVRLPALSASDPA
jgi:C4-dicarboxylate-specific signal transduction histidine kinase